MKLPEKPGNYIFINRRIAQSLGGVVFVVLAAVAAYGAISFLTGKEVGVAVDPANQVNVIIRTQ